MTSKEKSILLLVVICLLLGAGIVTSEGVIAEVAMVAALFAITVILAHNLAEIE